MPIIGHGDIARVIPDRPDRLYFAAGVSNSQETRASEYLRELKLLLAQPSDAHLVYFSSLSVLYADTRYTRHKRMMEVLVKQFFARYCVLRLGNITWGTNPHTLLNHLRAERAAGHPLDIRPVYRHLCTLDDFLFWLALIPDYSCELAVTGQRLTVQQIVDGYL